MEGFRLLEKCEEAARAFSKRESLDVLVVCENDSKYLYIDGEERMIPWLAGSMPLRPHGEQVPYMDLRPVQVQSGHWSDEGEKFVPSRLMSVEEFLSLA